MAELEAQAGKIQGEIYEERQIYRRLNEQRRENEVHSKSVFNNMNQQNRALLNNKIDIHYIRSSSQVADQMRQSRRTYKVIDSPPINASHKTIILKENKNVKGTSSFLGANKPRHYANYSPEHIRRVIQLNRNSIDNSNSGSSMAYRLNNQRLD